VPYSQRERSLDVLLLSLSTMPASGVPVRKSGLATLKSSQYTCSLRLPLQRPLVGYLFEKRGLAMGESSHNTCSLRIALQGKPAGFPVPARSPGYHFPCDRNSQVHGTFPMFRPPVCARSLFALPGTAAQNCKISSAGARSSHTCSPAARKKRTLQI
jgi:hypothetical protein